MHQTTYIQLHQLCNNTARKYECPVFVQVEEERLVVICHAETQTQYDNSKPDEAMELYITNDKLKNMNTQAELDLKNISTELRKVQRVRVKVRVRVRVSVSPK